MELETSPVSRASYRLVPVEMAVQEEQLNIIKQGFYEVEYFTVGSTSIVTIKEDESFKLCIVYKDLNKVIIKDRHSLQCIDKLLD